MKSFLLYRMTNIHSVLANIFSKKNEQMNKMNPPLQRKQLTVFVGQWLKAFKQKFEVWENMHPSGQVWQLPKTFLRQSAMTLTNVIFWYYKMKLENIWNICKTQWLYFPDDQGKMLKNYALVKDPFKVLEGQWILLIFVILKVSDSS